MFEKNFRKALDFYFWEVIDPNEPPSQWSPHKHNDEIITVWRTHSDKNGLTSYQAYDPKKERFLTSSEYWKRSDKRIKEKYGKIMILPVYEKEWNEFQKWKREKNEN